jgi:valacyclovir hydrolase
LEAFELYRDVSNWHPKLREEGESVYGAEGLWEIMFQALRTIYEQEDGDLYCGFLPRIQCKTLVVGGGKDKLVADFHAEYLNERILHSRLHVFPEGRHDVLLSLHEEFNQVLGDFLEEPDDKLTQSREYVAKPMKS